MGFLLQENGVFDNEQRTIEHIMELYQVITKQ